jgi:integrase
VWSQYHVASVRSGWDTARLALGLPQGWGPKLLRHSMATILANRRVPQTERKLLMGHETLEDKLPFVQGDVGLARITDA